MADKTVWRINEYSLYIKSNTQKLIMQQSPLEIDNLEKKCLLVGLLSDSHHL